MSKVLRQYIKGLHSFEDTKDCFAWLPKKEQQEASIIILAWVEKLRILVDKLPDKDKYEKEDI